MTVTTNSPRRIRGCVLTSLAYQHLNEAKKRFEIEHNDGYVMTLSELAIHTQLSRNTLLKIQSCKEAVDKSSLKMYFEAFGLQLSKDDYCYVGRLRHVEIDVPSLSLDDRTTSSLSEKLFVERSL